jgi:subtilisin-like proprotein convertase family protein
MRYIVPFFLALCLFASLGATQVASGNVNLPIPDNGSVSSTINIPTTGALCDVNIGVNLTHTWDDDLTITIAHAGTSVVLVANRGAGGDNFTGTIFDDQATAAISSGTPPFTGSFRPQQALAAFNGLSLSGNWVLTITDASDPDVGTLLNWYVEYRVVGLNTDRASSGTVNLAISDNNTITSTLALTSPVTLRDVNIGLTITHTWDADLTITIAHAGWSIILANNCGSSGDNFTNTIFDDEAATAITAGSAPFTGSFRPIDYLGYLAGLPLQGDWVLSVTDNAEGDTGTLVSWFVEYTYAIPPNPPINPAPVNTSLIAGLDTTLTWTFGAGATTYDLYFGADNPPTTQLVSGEAAGATGSCYVNGLSFMTRYYWQVVEHSEYGTTTGPVWCFDTPLAHGTGTTTDPYQVANLTDLKWISEHSGAWSSVFVQTADIDAYETRNWNSGQGFSPVGNSTTNFTGSYDGQGHNITDLYLNRPSSYYQGLFGFASYATLQNLVVNNVEAHGNQYQGGLAAYAYYCSILNCQVSGQISGVHYSGLFGGVAVSSTITNCHSSGQVSSTGYAVGGLIGFSNNSSFTMCSSSSAVIGLGAGCAGLVGEAHNGNLTACFATGNVSGSTYIGGLIGYTSDEHITDGFATGNVVANSDYAGGLVGRSVSITLSNSYSTGLITCPGAHKGGLVGASTGTINGCFWNTETSGMTTSAAGTGLTNVQMRNPATFLAAGWDFIGETENGSADTWSQDGFNYCGFPFLTWQNPTTTMDSTPASIAFGSAYLGQTDYTRTITLHNTGTANYLMINQVFMVNGNAGFHPLNLTLPCGVTPGDSLSIVIGFNPTAQGTCSDVLRLVTNATNTPTRDIALSGTGYSVAPAAPQNLQPLSVGNSMVLTWDPVTQTATGLPMAVDVYAVLYSETPDASTNDYLFQGMTTDCTYTHAYVLHFSNRMFYRVVAVMWSDHSTRGVPENPTGQTTTWGQEKQLLGIE